VPDREDKTPQGTRQEEPIRPDAVEAPARSGGVSAGSRRKDEAGAGQGAAGAAGGPRGPDGRPVGTADAPALSPEEIRAEVEATAAELQGQVPADPARAQPEPVHPEELTREDMQRLFYLNEYGDADLAVMLFRTRFVLDNATASFYRWQDHRWHKCRNREQEGEFREVADLYSQHAAACARDMEAAVAADDNDQARVHKTWRDNFNKRAKALRGTARMRSVLTLATAGAGSLGVSGEHWNQDYRLLPVANGVVDLETGTLRDGRWDDWCNAGSPIEYAGYHHGGDFVPRFLEQLMCGEQELVEYMELLLGFAATGIQTKDFFVAYGPRGWNGKSVWFEWVCRVLGEFAATLPVEMIYEDRFGRDPDKPSPQTLRLRGLRLAVMTEPEGNKRLSPAKVKSYTSGTDKLGGRALHEKETVYFDPTHTLVMHGNEVPRVMGHQGPFYDRLRLIPFRARFVRDPDEVDEAHHVFLQTPRAEMERLLREHDQEMLSFLVRCARKALAAGDMPPPPAAVLKETQGFRDEEDTVGRFVRQCTQELPESYVQAKDLYRSFCFFCREELGLSAKSTPSLKSISGDLRAQPHIERDDKGRTVRYWGVKIHPEWIPDEDWK